MKTHCIFLFVSICLVAVQCVDFNEEFMRKVLLNVNASVDPCDDFYAHACGNWSANYKRSEDYVDMAGFMEHKFNTQLLAALEMRYHQGGVYGQLWDYFSSCRRVEHFALNEILHLLEEELQLEWPIFSFSKWANETQFDWLRVIGQLRSYGLNGVLLTQDVTVRQFNGSHYVLLVQPHDPKAGKELQEQPLFDLHIAFGLDIELAKNLTQKLLLLEQQLANLTQLVQEKTLEEVTLVELAHRLPQIDWRHYFHVILGYSVNETQLVQVVNLSSNYLAEEQRILRGTSNSTLCSYLMFKLLYKLQEQLPQPDQSTGTVAPLDCITQLRGLMSLAMNLLYEQHYYAERRQRTDNSLLNLYEELRGHFEELILRENHLRLDTTEIAFLLEELRTMRLKIGNIPSNVTVAQVSQYYNELRLRNDDFFGNTLQLLRFVVRQDQRQLKNTHVGYPDHYILSPATARASSPVKIFYNAVVLPYGFLQLPLFDAALEALPRRAQLGFMLAHELVHAFDLFHIKYDARGNYNTTGLAVTEHFEEFTSCFVRESEEMELLSESMADIVGLRLAYVAHFAHRNVTRREQQLFFIHSVQFLCANTVQMTALGYVHDAEHGVHNERVNRNWPHDDHFADSFQCRPGHAMYLKRRCRLW